MDIYERQESLRLKNISRAYVVGVGGTGFWTAFFLAMSGVKHLILIDDDRIEASNLNRLPCTQYNIGAKKVTVCKNFILNYRNDIMIETYDIRIKTDEDCNVILPESIVFCCTDNLKSQQLLYAYCKKNFITYQRSGYDGTILNVSNSFPLTLQPAEQIDNGYTITPSWIIPAVISSALAVYSQMKEKITYTEDISQISAKTSTHCPECILKKAYDDGYDDGYEDGKDDIPDSYGYCPDCEQYQEGYDEGYANAERELNEQIEDLEDELRDLKVDYRELVEENESLRQRIKELETKNRF